MQINYVKATKEPLSSFLPGSQFEQILNPAEIAALIKHASESGIDEPELISDLYGCLRNYGAAEASKNADAMEDATQQMLHLYTRLTTILGGINGRKLIAGRNLWWTTKWFMLLAMVTFAMCIGTLALGDWVRNEPLGDDFFLGEGVTHIIQFFTPFFWGALGAFVYILKRITDYAADNQFDPHKFQGWFTRLSLGAILGGIITYIIDPSAFGEVTLNSTAIAFLTGMGTKVIYGGLQRLIQILADKMNLEALHEQKQTEDPVTEYLAEELTKVNPEDEPERFKILTALLDNRATLPAR